MLRSVQFFLSAEVWERVSEHGHRKMAVQHLPRSESNSEIDSAKKKQENRRFVMTKAFAESSKCRAEILTFSSPASYVFLSGANIPDREMTPHASVFVSVQGQMLGCSSLLNGGGLKSAETRFSRRLYVPEVGRVSKTFGKRQSPSKLQLCRFSKAN